MILRIAVFAAALVSASPPVAVDVDALALPHAQTQQLHGELMTRLVEEGHSVGSSGVVTVRLVGAGEQVHVEVQHGRTRLTREVNADEPALMRLAVVHAVLELLFNLEAAEGPLDPGLAENPSRTVVVEARPGAQREVAAVVRAVVEGGRVVTGDPADAEFKLCVDVDGEGVTQLAATTVGDACPLMIAATDLAVVTARVLDSASHAEAEPAIPPQGEEPKARVSGSDSEEIPSGEARDSDAPPVATSPSSSWHGALGVGLGAQTRIRAPEALLLVHGDARHRSGARLTARVSVAPSIENTVRTTDTWVTVGGGWVLRPTPRLRFELAATVGLAVHTFTVGPQRGARLDFAAELPLAVVGRVGRRVELGLAPVVGWTSRGRRHRTGNDVVWERSPWRVGGLAVLRILLREETAVDGDG